MIVIADDITGAAEIAGIAFERGQQVRLVCGSTATSSTVCCDSVATYPIIVIATDTRSMTEGEAVAETLRIASSFPISRSSLLIYKKTDSALRGHVIAELKALMQATGYQRVVYLPANPTKGRIVRGGIYYIKEERGERKEEREVPIHETDFSFDPEFPARTSSLKERFPDAEAAGIIMPDAESLDDIRRVIARYDDGHTLFAGAADLFTLVLEHFFSTSSMTSTSRKTSTSSMTSGTLILCGSTQSRALDLGIPIAPMPREVYDGSCDLNAWDTTAYKEQHSLILTIPHTHRTGKNVAIHLRTMMAEMACRLVEEHCPDHLIIEGGATAWATLQALGWTAFEIERQVAPGVVQMRSVTNGTLVTLKPGSYPWGGYLNNSSSNV